MLKYVINFVLFIVIPLMFAVGVAYYADENRIFLLFGIYPAIFAYIVGMMVYAKV